jgi:hypothetical protein
VRQTSTFCFNLLLPGLFDAADEAEFDRVTAAYEDDWMVAVAALAAIAEG